MPQANLGRTITRDHALALHRAGNVSKALLMYEALLKKDPKNADVLGLIGMSHFQLGNWLAAKAAWRDSLSQRASAPIMLRNMNNLMTAYLKNDTADDLQFLADLPVPDWPLKTVPNQGEKGMIISLARGLLRIGRKSTGLKLVESALLCISGDAQFIKNAAEIVLEAGNAERASILLEPLAAKDVKDGGELLILQAAAAFEAGQREKARMLSAKAIEALPVYITPKLAGQIMLIGVLNPAPNRIEKNMSPQLLHFSKNSPSNLAWKFNHTYRSLSIFPEASTARAALDRSLKPDLILNNFVNAEALSTPNTLEFVCEFADSLGLPVLNHPRHAAATTRQRNAERLSGIPNLLVPRIVRFFNDPAKRDDLVRAIGHTIGFPVIIRNPFMQMGREAAKIETPGQLKENLDQGPAQELYAIEFIDNPVAGGLYRKIRAAVIGKEITISHVIFARKWSVHREHAPSELEAMNPEPAVTQFADRIISNPVEAIGKAGMLALEEIRKRTLLDYYGIDFDLMPDGKLLFFEANAAMKFGLTGCKSQEESRIIMRAALRRLFEETRDRNRGDSKSQ